MDKEPLIPFANDEAFSIIESQDKMEEIGLEGGWVKLYRAIRFSRCWLDAELLKVWIYCLIKANHKECWISVQTGIGYTEVKISPGQFIFGRRIAAQELQMKLSSVRNRFMRLKKMGNVDIQVDTHFSIITIINWDKYQSLEMEAKQATKQPSGQAQDRHRTGTGQAQDTNKNVKNEKNEKKKEDIVVFSREKTDNIVNLPDGKIDEIDKKFVPENLFNAFRDNNYTFPQPNRLTKERRAKCLARCKTMNQTPELFEKFIEGVQKVQNSSFAKQANWCNFDWFVHNDNNYLKAAEGKYDDRDPRKEEIEKWMNE